MRRQISRRNLLHLFGLLVSLTTLQMIEANDKFLDRWALTIPDGRAGWLEVTKHEGYYDAHILWGGGSVVPVDSVFFSDDNTLTITRSKEIQRKDAAGKIVRTQRFTDAIMAKVNGEEHAVDHRTTSNGWQWHKTERISPENVLPHFRQNRI